MRTIILTIIRTYWYLMPQKLRRKCLYKETCSHHAYGLTKELGWQAGLQSIWARYNSCRPGFYFVTTPTGLYATMADGAVLPIEDLSDEVVAPYLALIENKNTAYVSKHHLTSIAPERGRSGDL